MPTAATMSKSSCGRVRRRWENLEDAAQPMAQCQKGTKTALERLARELPDWRSCGRTRSGNAQVIHECNDMLSPLLEYQNDVRRAPFIPTVQRPKGNTPHKHSVDGPTTLHKRLARIPEQKNEPPPATWSLHAQPQTKHFAQESFVPRVRQVLSLHRAHLAHSDPHLFSTVLLPVASLGVCGVSTVDSICQPPSSQKRCVSPRSFAPISRACCGISHHPKK